MKKLTTLILCSLFVSTFACAADDVAPKSTSQILKDSFKLSKEGKFSEALANVNALLEKDPKNASALRARGNIFFAENKFADAYKDFAAIVELQPTSARAYFDRGIAGFTVGREVESIDDIDFALALNPKLIESLNAAPQIREKIEELRKEALSSVGQVRMKKGSVNMKKGSILMKDNVISK